MSFIAKPGQPSGLLKQETVRESRRSQWPCFNLNSNRYTASITGSRRLACHARHVGRAWFPHPNSSYTSMWPRAAVTAFDDFEIAPAKWPLRVQALPEHGVRIAAWLNEADELRNQFSRQE